MLVAGAAVSAVAGAGLELVVHRSIQPSMDRFPVAALPAAGIAAAVCAVAWAVFLWRAAR